MMIEKIFSTRSLLKQEQMQLIVNLDSTEQRQSLVKTSYKIPSPTIQLSSPINPQSFYLKTPEELLPNSVNLLRTISSDVTHQDSINRFTSMELNLPSDNPGILSEDSNGLPTSPFEITPHRKLPLETKQVSKTIVFTRI